MSKKEAIEKIAGYLGDDVLSMSTTNNGSGLTTDSRVGSKDNSSAKGKITLEEFFARTDKVVLNIPTQEEFSALMKIFKDLGITTNSGREFKEGMWKKYEHLTIISSDRKIGAGVEIAKYHGYEVIEFKDLDLSKYLHTKEVSESGVEELPNKNKEIPKKEISVVKSEVGKSIPIEELDEYYIDNSTLKAPNYKITIDSFWGEKGYKCIAIRCNEQLQSEILRKVFDKMGETWCDGDKYTKVNWFKKYGEDTCYANNNKFESYQYYTEKGWSIYEFSEVDLSKYLTPYQVYEIKSKLGFNPLQKLQDENNSNTQSQKGLTLSDTYDITIDEFCAKSGKKNMAIHCDKRWKSIILREVFDSMGKTWCDGDKYTKKGFFKDYKENTCYANTYTYGSYQTYTNRNYDIYDFSRVDLTKYLTPAQVKEIRKKLGFDPLSQELER